MRGPARAWLVLAVLYGVFFYWYTPLGGALTAEEIERYALVLQRAGAEPERLAVWRQFMETDTGDDFAMVNVIDMRDTPLEVEGAEPGESSAEVLARYTTPFLGRAAQSAAHPVFLGTAAAPSMDLWGIEGAERWSTGGLVRYRSRRDLVEQVVYASDLDSRIHDFKIAAMAKTIAFPVDPWFQLGDPRLVLGLLFLVIGLLFQLRATRAR